MVNSGPPATTFRPAALHRLITRRADSRCTTIALTITKSAHARSCARSRVTFKSTRRFDQSAGSMVATVSSPNGGEPARFRMNFSACLKLQNVSGHSG